MKSLIRQLSVLPKIAREKIRKGAEGNNLRMEPIQQLSQITIEKFNRKKLIE